MGYLHLAIFFVILSTISAASIPKKNETADPLAENFFKLPDDEKDDFIRFFLNRGVNVNQRAKISFPGGRTVSKECKMGIPQDHVDKFIRMNIPQNSVEKLVGWTKRQFSLDDAAIGVLARRREICDSNGVCVSVPDVGTLCCPW